METKCELVEENICRLCGSAQADKLQRVNGVQPVYIHMYVVRILQLQLEIFVGNHWLKGSSVEEQT